MMSSVNNLTAHTTRNSALRLLLLLSTIANGLVITFNTHERLVGFQFFL